MIHAKYHTALCNIIIWNKNTLNMKSNFLPLLINCKTDPMDDMFYMENNDVGLSFSQDNQSSFLYPIMGPAFIPE